MVVQAMFEGDGLFTQDDDQVFRHEGPELTV